MKITTSSIIIDTDQIIDYEVKDTMIGYEVVALVKGGVIVLEDFTERDEANNYLDYIFTNLREYGEVA